MNDMKENNRITSEDSKATKLEKQARMLRNMINLRLDLLNEDWLTTAPGGLMVELGKKYRVTGGSMQCRRILKTNGSLLIADEIMPRSFPGKLLRWLLRLPFAAITFIFTQTTTRAIASLDEELKQAGFNTTRQKSYLLGTLKLFQARKVIT